MSTVRVPVTFDTASGARKAAKDVERVFSKVKLRLDDRGFTQPLGRITAASSEFQKSLEASNARVVAFAASAGILYKLSQAFDFLVKSTINVEKQLKDINVVLGATNKGIKQFGSDLFKIIQYSSRFVHGRRPIFLTAQCLKKLLMLISHRHNDILF